MSNESKFQSVPSSDDFKIPFKLEEKSLLNWLADLSHVDGKEACSQTLSLLQALYKSESANKNYLVFLKLINEYLKQYIKHLEHPCWDAGFPLSPEEKTYAEMVVWNYLILGESFFIAADHSNKKNDAVVSLAMALQVLGQAQLHIAAVYSTPGNTFWKQAYQIFSWAEKRKLQHLPIESDELKNLTINTLFARSLIFQVSDTNQFHSKEMRTIFNFLPTVCKDLPITIYPSEQQGMFMLDLKSDTPPHDVKAQTELGSELVRYFSPVLVAAELDRIIQHGDLWSGTLKSINSALFARVAKTLGLQQKRQYERKPESHSLLGVIGFEDIIGFLHKTAKNKVIDPQKIIKKNNSASPDLDVFVGDELSKGGRGMIGGHEDYQLRHKIAINNKPIWEQSKTGDEIPFKKVSLKELKVCDSSANGYSVSWNQEDSKAKIGDLFGIVSEDRKRLEIAIIRRIALNSGNDFRGDFRFGAELLGFESEIVYLVSVENENTGGWAVFIPGIEMLERPDTLIYRVGTFKVGENVHLYRGDKTSLCLLIKELHCTVAISHAEVVFITKAK